MPNVMVKGVTDGSYTNKQGNRVIGCRFYVEGAELVAKEGAEYPSSGHFYETVWVSKNLINSMGFIPSAGDTIHIEYNRYGGIDKYSPA